MSVDNMPVWAQILITLVMGLGGGGFLVKLYDKYKDQIRQDDDHVIKLYRKFIEDIQVEHNKLKVVFTEIEKEHTRTLIENAELKIQILQLRENGRLPSGVIPVD